MSNFLAVKQALLDTDSFDGKDSDRQRTYRKDWFHLADDAVKAFVDEQLGKGMADRLQWYHTTEMDDIPVKGDPIDNYKGLANLQRINDVTRINGIIKRANFVLPECGYHMICLETMHQRKMRIMGKYPAVVNGIYYFLDFILKRVFPKFGPTRKLYYRITKGRNRVMSLTEAMGRLVANGFTIISYKPIGRLTYILTQKEGDPDWENKPTLGAICRLNRVGFNGDVFTVYKMRTMYPYSEYLQDYVFKLHNLQEGGKLKSDFRVTSWGRMFRRLWIDELPMLYNWLKGDMKLVGVRPLSRHYFELYPEDLQELRTKVHPGLVPPYYADMPQTLEEIIESERKYIKAYLEKPHRTDFQYFCKAMANIFIRGARSK